MNRNRNLTQVRVLVLILIILMLGTVCTAPLSVAHEMKSKTMQTNSTKPENSTISSGDTVTWDCVYFGHYPQTSNDSGGFNNDRIKWRVLSVNGRDAFLIADKNLDVKAYNTGYTTNKHGKRVL